MTRRVRSGSSQKHKKMPGDATKWGEFDNQHAREFSPKKKKNIKSQTELEQKFKVSHSNYLPSKDEESLNADFFNENKYCLAENLDNLNEQKNGTFHETCSNIKLSPINNDHDNNRVSRKIVCDPEIKKKSDEMNLSEVPSRYKKIKLENNCPVLTQTVKISKQDDNDNNFAENSKNPEASIFQQEKKNRKKKKLRKSYNKNDSESFSVNNVIVEASLSNSISFDNFDKSTSIKQDVDSLDKSTVEYDKSFQNVDNSSKEHKMNSDSNQSSMNNESYKKSSSKVFENKKEKYLKKLQKKREKLGLLLLPHNAECKLQKIKKKLMQKGLPPEKQKEIMRQVRRKEELKYRKVFNPSKLCFGCREAGHILADCPKKSESLKQETGICFKCGSVEHTSKKCPNKVQGFPYAKCFICKEQGHISRDCPINKHGVYPKGGRCKLCGNINHLKKDCPTLKKKESEEESFTLHTLDADASIDAEVVGKKEFKKKTGKKAKIVKF